MDKDVQHFKSDDGPQLLRDSSRDSISDEAPVRSGNYHYDVHILPGL